MSRKTKKPRSVSAWMLLTMGALTATGCATGGDTAAPGTGTIEDSRIGSSVIRPSRTNQSTVIGQESEISPEELTDRTSGIRVPSVSRVDESAQAEPLLELEGPEPANASVDAVVPALPIPQFIDVVFGNMLGVPYTTGPGVAERKELIQLRSSGRMPSADFIELVSRSLEGYGIKVYPADGSYQIVTDASLQSKMPRFIKSRSRADIPEEQRPVVQFVELDAVSANEMESILRQAFPDKQSLKIETNPRLNVLTLTGMPRDLDGALSIIDQLDELAYAGSQAERYSPIFWSATQLASEVAALLEAEGWQASTNKAVQKPILIMPVEYSNDLFIFSRSAAGLSRVRFWMSELDRPTRQGNAPQVYIYDVQNVDAQLLAEVASNVIARQSAPAPEVSGLTATDPSALSGASAQATSTSSNLNRPGNIVVNTLSNQIIYTGTPTQYDLIYPMLRQLDRAPAEVMIEVTIAEITLTDDTQYGVEFFIDSLGDANFAATLGNEGLGLGGVGTSIGLFTGNVEAALNFFSRNNLLNVLSTPRLTARSGGSAQIQVGSDVPLITSQRAADSQSGGSTDILQSVDYRSTGVLLSIEPIVFGDNRVDLSITQEVSTAIPTTSSEISSPTISNRSVTTQLSLEDGATAVLGGLIQETTTRDETGMPILKDIPLLGAAFRNTTLSSTRTELIVLITAYVMRDGEEKQAFTDELVSRFNLTAETAGDLSTYTGGSPLK